MINILIIITIVLVFSFVIGLIIYGNDNRISEQKRKNMVDDPKILFEDDNNNSNVKKENDKNISDKQDKKENKPTKRVEIDDDVI